MPCGGGKNKQVGPAVGRTGAVGCRGLAWEAGGSNAGGMRAGVRWIGIAVIGGAVALASALLALRAVEVEAKGKAKDKDKEKVACAAAAAPEAVTYAQVEPIFTAKCASCHDARKSDNAPPQKVFEMSRGYPFSTTRPETLIADLKHMFEVRGNLTADEKCLGTAWLAGGARDAEGNLPRWRE